MVNRVRPGVSLPGLKWDAWQEDVLATDGNITIRAGRQVGKFLHDFVVSRL